MQEWGTTTPTTSVIPESIEVGPEGHVYVGAYGFLTEYTRYGKYVQTMGKDLVLHFSTGDLQLTADSTSATLTGKTLSGRRFTGTDSVRVVPRR